MSQCLLEHDGHGAGGAVDGQVIAVCLKALGHTDRSDTAQLPNVPVDGEGLSVQLLETMLDILWGRGGRVCMSDDTRERLVISNTHLLFVVELFQFLFVLLCSNGFFFLHLYQLPSLRKQCLDSPIKHKNS